MNYSLQQIADITGGRLKGGNLKVANITTDSRSACEPAHTLFVALHGEHRNGHGYVAAMYQQGVRAFLVSSLPEGSHYLDAGFVLCDDTLKALQAWAAHHRANYQGKVVAITGSNGKTVVKEWIAQLCPADLKLFRSPKSYNSQIGVPLSILMIAGDEDIAVIEAGMSRSGEMECLEQIIRPDIGVFTNIGAPHQENFTTITEKLQEKLRLFARARTIIYNNADRKVEEAVRDCFTDRRLVPVNGDMYDLHDLSMQDTVSRSNASQAICLFETLGYLPEDIIGKLPKLQPVAMRLELKEGIGGGVLVNDSYNLDINSLTIALDYLSTVAADREKILILSDIFQSGMSAVDLYSEVERLISAGNIKRLFGIGPEISRHSSLFSIESTFYASTDEFLKKHDRLDFSGQAVLLKGSRLFQFERISRALELKVHTTVLEVNLDHMIHNLNVFRRILQPGVQVMAMVKAMGYGSGSYEVANQLQQQGVAYLAVAFADEGVVLRDAGITMPIVVLNADSDSFPLMVEYRLEPEIYSFSSLEAFADVVRRTGEQDYPIHIKLDTGMHRLGFVEKETDELIVALLSHRELLPRSVFSHLAVSDDPKEDQFTREQIDRFQWVSDRILVVFPGKNIWRHINNSVGIERFPDAQFDMVRLGIGLYGIGVEHQRDLLPVGTLKTRIVQIKELQPGETVGYGRHGKIMNQARIATIPVGYADGLDRRLSRGNWSVRVNGQIAPIIGNICMDTCMIDITGLEAAEGDIVTVFGDTPTVAEMAARLDTIPYEILTGISSRVKRVYLKE